MLFPVCENRRHSRGLGWRAGVSGWQILEFRLWIGGFAVPVSARHFPIFVSVCQRLVRYVAETGLRSAGNLEPETGPTATATDSIDLAGLSFGAGILQAFVQWRRRQRFRGRRQCVQAKGVEMCGV